MLKTQPTLAFVFALAATSCTSVQSTAGLETTDNPATTVVLDEIDANKNREYVTDDTRHQLITCREVESLGSRLPKTECGPVKDDRELFGVIDSGGTQEPH